MDTTVCVPAAQLPIQLPVEAGEGGPQPWDPQEIESWAQHDSIS